MQLRCDMADSKQGDAKGRARTDSLQVVRSAESGPFWPFSKIERNLTPRPRGRRCMLLSTGAFNPLHLGHVAMFDKAKDALESCFGLRSSGDSCRLPTISTSEAKGTRGN